MSTRFAHVNLVATDWRRLATFYQEVFGCRPVPPERHLAGDWLSRATGVPDAVLEGIHLRLPGGGESGPTLEVFQYAVVEAGRSFPPANRKGLSHIAFEVEDVNGTLNVVLKCGGTAIGEVVTRDVAGAGRITFAYVRDPEDNIIELQQWDTCRASD